MITVIMPAYNAEKYIKEAVESILNQTYPDFEFIIVDDGSTDRTPEILKHYAEKDRRVRVVQGSHEGLSAALNRAASYAQTEWIAVMHADDISYPKRLERQMRMAQKYPEVVIWGTHGHHINSQGKRLSVFKVGPTSIEKCNALRRQAKPIQSIHPTVMFKRAAFEAVGGYDSRTDAAEDLELFDRLLEHGPLVTIPELLVGYRIHSETLSMTKYSVQRKGQMFVTMRQKRRLAGKSDLTWEEFVQHYQNLPPDQSRKLRRSNFVGLSYRRAGMAYGEQQYHKMIYHLMRGFVVDPRYVIKRIWEQWTKPRLNHWFNGSLTT